MKCPNLIKVLKLKEGCKYILIVPESAGLTREEIARLDSHFVNLGIMVHSTRGIKFVEYIPVQRKIKNALSKLFHQ